MDKLHTNHQSHIEQATQNTQNQMDTKNSEYEQEIPQSQTAAKPYGTAKKSHTTIMRHQEDKLSKATSCLFPIKMIAKLEWT